MLVLLDTTVLIDYLRGKPAVERVDALLARGDTPCTSPVNVEEIVRGLRASEAAAAERLFDGLHMVRDRSSALARRGVGMPSARRYPPRAAVVPAIQSAYNPPSDTEET